MPRFIIALLVVLAGLPMLASAAPADGLPTRPVPFTFVTDQGKLLQAGEAKKLDSGLRRYAASTGTQVVVVTVPSLGGTDVAEYGRQLGTAWGVGQRGKNNGVVVLLAAKEHQVAIEAGSGLKDALTPAITSRIITQEMTPAFKQGNYFGGLRKGLSTLMLAANPSSNPDRNKPAATSAAATGAGASLADQTPGSTGMANPAGVQQVETAAPSSGLGMGTLLIGAVVIIGGIWLLTRLFRRGNSNATSNASQAPNFMGNRPPNSPTPNFGAPNAGYPQQQGYGGNAPASSGSGIGGMLATGAAAAAGAYIGNRMSSNHEESSGTAHNLANEGGSLGAAPAAGAAGDYFSSRGEGNDTTSAPDYFSDDAPADNSGDYFSDDASYDDTASDDTGGGGFDGDDSKGSW